MPGRNDPSRGPEPPVRTSASAAQNAPAVPVTAPVATTAVTTASQPALGMRLPVTGPSVTLSTVTTPTPASTHVATSVTISSPALTSTAISTPSSCNRPGITDEEIARTAMIVKAVLEQQGRAHSTPALGASALPPPTQPAMSPIRDNLGTAPLPGLSSPSAFSSFRASPSLVPNAQASPPTHASAPTRNYLHTQPQSQDSLLQESVNTGLSNVRRNLVTRERSDLDSRVGKFLRLPFCAVVSELREDFSTSLTISSFQDLLTFALRVLDPSQGSRPLMNELRSLSDRLNDCRRHLFRDGEQGPSQPPWRIAADIITRLCDKVELEMMRCRSDSVNATAFTGAPDLSGLSMHSNMGLCIQKVKSMANWDQNQDIDDFLSHFEFMTRGMDIDNRRDWLRARLGTPAFRRLHGIEDLRSWDEVKRFVSRELSECVDHVVVSAKLDKLTQTGGVISYNDEWISLLSKMGRNAHDILDTSTIVKYIHGLSDFKMRKRLISRHRQNARKGNSHDTLWTFMDMARQDMENAKAAGEDVFDAAPGRHHSAYVATGSSAPPPSGTGNGVVLAAQVQCYRHDTPNKHTVDTCKTPVGICPYCKQKVPDAQFRDGSHKKVCAEKSCSYCKRRGHTADDCNRKAFDTGGKDAVKALVDARNSKRRDGNGKRKRTGESGSAPPSKRVMVSENTATSSDSSESEQNASNGL